MMPSFRAISRGIALCSLCIALDAGAATVARKPSYSNQPFTLSNGKVPPGFLGVDAAQLVQTLAQTNEPSKQEFETGAAFAVRLQKWRSQSIIGAIALDSPIAFVLPRRAALSSEQLITYDADQRRFTVNERAGTPFGTEWSRSPTQLRKYVASNAFGVKVNVSSLTDSAIVLDYPSISERTISMSVDRAREIRPHIRVALVGVLVGAAVETIEYGDKATVRRPIERITTYSRLNLKSPDLLVFDERTGEVIPFDEVVQSAPPKSIISAPPSPAIATVPPPITTAGVACSNFKSEVALPLEAQREGLEKGQAVIEFTLTASGEVKDIKSISASDQVFAREGIRQIAEFRCAGQGRTVTLTVPLVFR